MKRPGVWIAILSTLGCFGFFYSVERASYSHVRKAECLGRVKYLAIAAQMYCSSNDDCFPGTAWDQALRPYLAKARGHNDKFFLTEVFDCPLLTREGKHYGYALNWAVMNKPASSFEKPEETIVFFETDALAPGVVANLQARNHARHGRGEDQLSCVGRADGTAKVIP